MKRIVILVIVALLGTLSACEGYATPAVTGPLAGTPQAAEAAAQATIAAGRAQMAAAAVHMTQAAATQAAFAAATAQAATATAQAHQATATARAQATATAQTATQQAYALAWTQQAVEQMGTATAQAMVVQGTATAQALTMQGTATAQVVAAQATALAAEAEKVQLEVEQQRMMNQAWAVTKWGLVLVFVGLLLLIAHRLTSTRIVKRSNGKVLVLSGGVVYDPDRNPAPLLQLGSGKATMPPVSEAAQEATTARDQAIALASALGGRRPPKSIAAVAAPAAAQRPDRLPVRVEVIPPERVRPWLEEVEQQLQLPAGEEVA